MHVPEYVTVAIVLCWHNYIHTYFPVKELPQTVCGQDLQDPSADEPNH